MYTVANYIMSAIVYMYMHVHVHVYTCISLEPPALGKYPPHKGVYICTYMYMYTPLGHGFILHILCCHGNNRFYIYYIFVYTPHQNST